jgi:hypothetical protein
VIDEYQILGAVGSRGLVLPMVLIVLKAVALGNFRGGLGNYQIVLQTCQGVLTSRKRRDLVEAINDVRVEEEFQ